jgi:hypothetical protein
MPPNNSTQPTPSPHPSSPPDAADPMLIAQAPPQSALLPDKSQEEQPKPAVKTRPPKNAKSKDANVGLAIVATVIIVIVLAALAVVAYSKQTH